MLQQSLSYQIQNLGLTSKFFVALFGSSSFIPLKQHLFLEPMIYNHHQTEGFENII